MVPHDQLKEHGWAMTMEEMDVDEDLPNFFKALPPREAKKVIRENEQMQREYGFELQESHFIE